MHKGKINVIDINNFKEIRNKEKNSVISYIFAL